MQKTPRRISDAIGAKRTLTEPRPDAVRDSTLLAWYPSLYAPSHGGEHDRSHWKARIHHAARRRGGGVAARCADATVGPGTVDNDPDAIARLSALQKVARARLGRRPQPADRHALGRRRRSHPQERGRTDRARARRHPGQRPPPAMALQQATRSVRPELRRRLPTATRSSRRQSIRCGSLSPRAASSPMAPTSSTSTVVPPVMSIASSGARGRPTCRCRRRPSTSW
jgi:hypothetical protein